MELFLISVEAPQVVSVGKSSGLVFLWHLENLVVTRWSVCTAETGYEGLRRIYQYHHPDWCWYLGQLVRHLLQSDYRHQRAHFEPMSIGAMFELVTEKLNFLSQLPQVPHVIIEDFAHLTVKCAGTMWCKRLFVQHEYLPSFQTGISIKTSCGLNWQMRMLLWCWLMGWVIFTYYVSRRQRFNGILPGSRATVYTENPSGEVSSLRTSMMVAVLINTALFNPPWFLLMQTLMGISKIPPQYLVEEISHVKS